MVEWKKLGEVCSNVYAGGKPITKHSEYYDGNIPWIRSGEVDFNVIKTAERNITEEGYKNSSAKKIRKKSVVMAMTGATVAKTAVVEIETTANQSVCAMETDENIIGYKYLYYFLAKNYFTIKSSAQGALTSINLAMIKDILIPIPSLSEQERIVGILDTFTASIDNIKAQIEQRRKQYEHYRNTLLTFNKDDDSVEWKTLGEVSYKICSGGTPLRENKEFFNGTIPWLRTQEVDWRDVYDTEIKITQEAIAKSSAKLIPENCVIIAMYGATAGKSCINKIPLTTNQACCNLQINDSTCLYKYVYHYVCREYNKLKALGEGSQNNIRVQKIKSYNIHIPSLARQQEIVSILDTFEASITNLEAQLEQRQKQYEYYREKLLTFE